MHEQFTMYEQFTCEVYRVLELANEEAQRFNHEYMEPGHALLGLTKFGKGIAVNVLRKLDVDLEKVRLELENSMNPEGATTEAAGEAGAESNAEGAAPEGAAPEGAAPEGAAASEASTDDSTTSSSTEETTPPATTAKESTTEVTAEAMASEASNEATESRADTDSEPAPRADS